MAKGYYTDLEGKILGYWSLDSIPENNDYLWVETDDLPEVHQAPLTIEQQVYELESQITPSRICEAFTDPTWINAHHEKIKALKLGK